MNDALLLDELLAGFAPPPVGAGLGTTPAKAAKAANREHSCGLAGHLALCEEVRNPAKPAPAGAAAARDSQPFADIRKPGSEPQSKRLCGFSQDSQDSQGVALPTLTEADLAAVAWTDADIARFMDRRARLMRWGWSEADAERLAERLVKRDREADPRVSCTDCQHYRPGRCGNHRAAGLLSPELARDLAELLQRCPGFLEAR